jgi:hypothetical protein
MNVSVGIANPARANAPTCSLKITAFVILEIRQDFEDLVLFIEIRLNLNEILGATRQG